MRIIITGGSGLIGNALTTELVKDCREVIVLSRNPERVNLPPGARAVKWDGKTTRGWAELVDGAYAVVNLAGESLAGDSLISLVTRRWSPAQKQLILESRLNAGKALVEAIQQARQKPAVLIQAGAVGFYGDRGDEILTEETSQGSDPIAEICRQWEQSTASVEAMGVRQAVIRTAGVVLSTRGGAFPFMLLPFRLFVGGPLGTGRQWFAWIHIADEVGAIRFLMDHPSASGPFNLVAPQSLTNGEFGRILGKVMRRPYYFPVPAFALRLAFGEKAFVLLGSQKQVPQRLTQLGYEFRFPQAEPALRDLLG